MSFSYSLNGIDPSLGKEIMNVSLNKKVSISFVLYPMEDLIAFSSSLTFQLQVPDDFHLHFKGIELSISSISLNEPSVLSVFEPYARLYDEKAASSLGYNTQLIDTEDFAQLSLPWLSSLSIVDLSIVFYAMRMLLRCPLAPDWLAPATITNKLIQTISSSSATANNKGCFSITCGAGRARGKRQYMEDREFTFANVRMATDKVRDACRR